MVHLHNNKKKQCIIFTHYDDALTKIEKKKRIVLNEVLQLPHNSTMIQEYTMCKHTRPSPK